MALFTATRPQQVCADQAFSQRAPRSSVALTFSHCGMAVTDLDRMVDFYTRVLGFVVTDRGCGANGATAFLTLDPFEHHQIVMSGGRPQGAHATLRQLAFRVDRVATLRKVCAALREEKAAMNDITLEGPDLGAMSHGQSISVYFRDPDGNRIEVFIDTPWAVPQPQRLLLDFSLCDDALWSVVAEHAQLQPGCRPMAQLQAEIARKLSDQVDRYA